MFNCIKEEFTEKVIPKSLYFFVTVHRWQLGASNVRSMNFLSTHERTQLSYIIFLVSVRKGVYMSRKETHWMCVRRRIRSKSLMCICVDYQFTWLFLLLMLGNYIVVVYVNTYFLLKPSKSFISFFMTFSGAKFFY